MKKILILYSIFALIMIVCISFVQANASEYGYVRDIKSEKSNIYEEIVVYLPQQTQQKSLNERIFNKELSTEFRTKYIQKFGTIDTDSFVYRDPKYAEMADDNRKGITVDQSNINARQDFAEFIVKRLTEWHFDHYLKEEPQMRPIYETKEKISNIKVELNKDTRLDIKYSLAGNTCDLLIINPYMESRLITYMDPSAFGPAKTIENRLFLGKQIQNNLRVNFYAAENDGTVTTELVRNFRNNITGTLSCSSWYKDTGITARETRTAIGMSTSF